MTQRACCPVALITMAVVILARLTVVILAWLTVVILARLVGVILARLAVEVLATWAILPIAILLCKPHVLAALAYGYPCLGHSGSGFLLTLLFSAIKY